MLKELKHFSKYNILNFKPQISLNLIIFILNIIIVFLLQVLILFRDDKCDKVKAMMFQIFIFVLVIFLENILNKQATIICLIAIIIFLKIKINSIK
jgi:hypothetical protein